MPLAHCAKYLERWTFDIKKNSASKKLVKDSFSYVLKNTLIHYAPTIFSTLFQSFLQTIFIHSWHLVRTIFKQRRHYGLKQLTHEIHESGGGRTFWTSGYCQSLKIAHLLNLFSHMPFQQRSSMKESDLQVSRTACVSLLQAQRRQFILLLFDKTVTFCWAIVQ